LIKGTEKTNSSLFKNCSEGGKGKNFWRSTEIGKENAYLANIAPT
jgi:hypothetical protein